MTYANEAQDMYTILIARKNGRVHQFKYKSGNEAHNKFVLWGSSKFVAYYSTAVALFSPDGYRISVWRFNRPNGPEDWADCTMPTELITTTVKQTTTTHE